MNKIYSFFKYFILPLGVSITITEIIFAVKNKIKGYINEDETIENKNVKKIEELQDKLEKLMTIHDKLLNLENILSELRTKISQREYK